MPLDSTATLTAEYIHQIVNDETTEHISLGEDFAVLAGAEEPEKITQRFEFSNLTSGRRTQLIFYAEGFLRVRQWQRKKKVRDYLLSLRFLGPTMTVARTIPMRVLHVAAGFAGFGLLCGLLSWLTPWNALFTPAAVFGATGTVISAMLFLYLANEKTMFATAAGNATVLTLLGTADSFKRCRSIVPAIVRAIEQAQAKNIQDRSDYLRQEMREHYRLREYDVIDYNDCSIATRRILAQFG
jgi:hypothetical protein